MATLKAIQDKENRIQFRQKPETMAAQKQRSVLGNLNANKAGEKVEKGAQKPCFGVRQDNVFSKSYQQQKYPQHNFYLPVAQFQAFKVYEDSPEQQELIGEVVPDGEEMDLVEEAEPTAYLDEDVVEVEEVKKDYSMSDLSIPVKSQSIESVFDESFNVGERSRELASEEYQLDIYKYMRQIELTNRPKPAYMKKQPDINHSMRTILVDWLVEVAEEYKLNSETLYLAINFIDRFLSYMSVVRAKLQLVGTAAMYIAAKYEEVYPPELSEFVYITDDTYTRRQVIRMEHLILKVLQFDLSNPSPLAFIKIISTLNKKNITPKLMHLAMYLCELGLLEAEPFLEFLPSMLAASAIALAQHTLGQDVWPQSFVNSTGFKLYHLKRCIIFLNIMFKKSANMAQKSIQEKYKNQKHYQVSNILAREDHIVFPEKVQQNVGHWAGFIKTDQISVRIQYNDVHFVPFWLIVFRI